MKPKAFKYIEEFDVYSFVIYNNLNNIDFNSNQCNFMLIRRIK